MRKAPRKWLRVESAASFADTSRGDIYRLLRSGKLTQYQFGEEVRIDLDELSTLFKPVVTSL